MSLTSLRYITDLLHRTDNIVSTRKLTLFSFILLGFSFNFITSRGINFVSHPRLVVIDDVLNYSGKGFESGRRGRPVKAAKVTSLESVAKSKSMARKESVLPMLSGQTTAKQD